MNTIFWKKNFVRPLFSRAVCPSYVGVVLLALASSGCIPMSHQPISQMGLLTDLTLCMASKNRPANRETYQREIEKRGIKCESKITSLSEKNAKGQPQNLVSENLNDKSKRQSGLDRDNSNGQSTKANEQLKCKLLAERLYDREYEEKLSRIDRRALSEAEADAAAPAYSTDCTFIGNRASCRSTPNNSRRLRASSSRAEKAGALAGRGLFRSSSVKRRTRECLQLGVEDFRSIYDI